MMACMPSPIRVVIADAYPVVRTGLVTTIEAEPQMSVVARAAHRHDLIPMLRATPAHVLVIDPDGMGDAPVALVREITRAHPQVGIVIFSDTLDFAPELLAVGAKAYVSKAEPDELLYLAIRAAKAGQRFLSPLAQDYIECCAVPIDKDRLTAKELRCLMYVADGLDNQEIANRMDVDLRTIQNYVSKIRKKTACTNRTQMASWYERMYGRTNPDSTPLRLHPQARLDRNHGT